MLPPATMPRCGRVSCGCTLPRGGVYSIFLFVSVNSSRSYTTHTHINTHHHPKPQIRNLPCHSTPNYPLSPGTINTVKQNPHNHSCHCVPSPAVQVPPRPINPAPPTVHRTIRTPVHPDGPPSAHHLIRSSHLCPLVPPGTPGRTPAYVGPIPSDAPLRPSRPLSGPWDPCPDLCPTSVSVEPSVPTTAPRQVPSPCAHQARTPGPTSTRKNF